MSSPTLKEQSALESTLKQFLPRRRGYQIELADFSLPERRLVIDQSAPHLSSQQVKQLETLSTNVEHFPARTFEQSRTLYAQFFNPAGWRSHGLKLKGAGGAIKNENGTWKIEPPAFDTLYNSPQLHFSLSDELQVLLIRGRPRTLRAMSTEAVHNEYENQNLLAAVDLGLPAVALGHFENRNTGERIMGVDGNPAGAVIVAHNPDLMKLTQVVLFVIIESKGKANSLVSHEKQLVFGYESPAFYIENYLEQHARAAQLKIRAALDAGIVRHAGQPDNFLVDCELDRMFLTDCDSCSRVSEIPVKLRGPALLRDFASDLVRAIANLSYFAYSNYYLTHLEDGSIRPFDRLMKGFFTGHASRETIDRNAGILHDQYLRFLHDNKEALASLAGALRDGIFSGRHEPPEITLRESWNHIHTPFTAKCLEAGYKLIRGGALQVRGFALPYVEQSLRIERFEQGISAFQEARVKR